MQAGTAEYLGNLDFAQSRTQCFEPLYGITDEIWKLVDRLANLYERICSLFIKSFHPGCDGGRRHKKRIGRLL